MPHTPENPSQDQRLSLAESINQAFGYQIVFAPDQRKRSKTYEHTSRLRKPSKEEPPCRSYT
jgi:hypothetical protein